MAKTVEEGFRSFHDDRLTQNTTETDAAKSHRATLEASLKANFAITSTVRRKTFRRKRRRDAGP